MEKKFFEMGKQLLAESDVEKLLIKALDNAIELSGAERGMIVLFKEGSKIHFQAARNLQSKDIDDPAFEVSRTIIESVGSSEQALCLRNALDDPAYRKSRSVARLKILSVICVPLRVEQVLFGALYLDNRTVRGVFEKEICELFVHQFADFISLAALKVLQQKQLNEKVSNLEEELRGKYLFESIIGHDPKMVDILQLVARVADTDAPVLIMGESGTGKELIARALHYNSRRKHHAFVAINCAAIPESLLESELFGHARGAFTGAVAEKEGWFETADGGTIFLDEIGEMPPHLQVKLLRILQTGEFSRVGAPEIKHCNVRVLSAASRDLHQLIQDGQFREEFYYRLNVIEIDLPPLRERRGDISLLAHHFLKQYAAKYKRGKLSLSREAETWLMNYLFPGNIRELENIIQRAVVLAETAVITPEHLPEKLWNPDVTRPQKELPSFKEAKQSAVEAFECSYIIQCLQSCHGNITHAARMARMDVKNFFTKMKKYIIDPQAYR